MCVCVCVCVTAAAAIANLSHLPLVSGTLQYYLDRGALVSVSFKK